MHNIGMLFVQMGRLEEAANSFEWVMREKPDLKAGMHAILCHFALTHEDKMKKGFLELLDVPLHIDHEDKYSMNTVRPIKQVYFINFINFELVVLLNFCVNVRMISLRIF